MAFVGFFDFKPGDKYRMRIEIGPDDRSTIWLGIAGKDKRSLANEALEYVMKWPKRATGRGEVIAKLGSILASKDPDQPTLFEAAP